MSDNREVAKDLITEAARTILQSRPGVHGSAEQSFEMIADMWTVYLRHLRRVRGIDALRGEDVAQMMTLLKKARALYGDAANRDNFIDDIGYAALAGMLQLPDPSVQGDVDASIQEMEKKIEVSVKPVERDSTIVHKHVFDTPIPPFRPKLEDETMEEYLAANANHSRQYMRNDNE